MEWRAFMGSLFSRSMGAPVISTVALMQGCYWGGGG